MPSLSKPGLRARPAGTGGVRRHRALRLGISIAGLAALLSLAACGGGDPAVMFDVGVVVAGQPVSGVVVQPGAVQSITISAGQSIELDASEPVQWTLLAGGSAITSNGATVYYQGVNITVTALSPSRIALDTYAAYPLGAAVPITLSAVSTVDSAQVATMDVLIVN